MRNVAKTGALKRMSHDPFKKAFYISIWQT
jgi:hypothetical protein